MKSTVWTAAALCLLVGAAQAADKPFSNDPQPIDAR